MQPSDLEALVGIVIAEGKEAMYAKRIKSAIGQAQKYCNNSFENEHGVVVIPDGADMGIALMVKAMGETTNIASQSLGDMSKSFFEGGTLKTARSYLKPFRKVGVR